MKISIIIYCVIIISQISLYSQNLKWEKLPGDYDQNVLCVAQDSSGILLIGTKTGLFVSSDEGQSWTKQKLEDIDSVEVTSIIINSKGIAYLGTFGEGVFERERETGEWKNINDDVINKTVLKLQQDRNDTLYIHTSYFKEKIKYFKVFKYLFHSQWQSFDKIETDQIMFNITKNNILYTWTDKFSILRSYDIDSQLQTLFPHGISGGPFCLIDDINGNYYLGTTYSVYKSVNNGITLKYTPLFMGGKSVRSIACTNISEIIAGTSENGIYYSNNGAESWEQNNEGLSSLNINLVMINKADKIFVATQNGIFKSHKPLNNKIETIGWQDKGNFLENKAFEIKLSDFKFYNNDSALVVISDNTLKVISIESGLPVHEKFAINYFGSGTILNIDDNEGLLYNLSSYNSILSGNLAVYYDLIADSISKVYNFSLKYAGYCSDAKFLNVRYYDNKLYYGASGWCQWKYVESGGKLEIIDMSDNSIIRTFDTGYRSNYTISNKGEYAVYISQDSIIVLDFNFKLVQWFPYINGLIKFKFTNDAKYLVGAATENRLIFWDVQTGEIFRILKGFSNENIVDFAISKNNRYVITGSNDGSLRTWDIVRGIPIDSVIFPPSNYNWKITISNAGNQFATGSDDGYIRLFKSDLLTSIDETVETENNYFSISPNPSTDFITVTLSNKGLKLFATTDKVQIFDMLGIKVAQTPSSVYNGNEGENTTQTGASVQLRIDISHLPTGVYFIRIGDRVEKFVKM